LRRLSISAEQIDLGVDEPRYPQAIAVMSGAGQSIALIWINAYPLHGKTKKPNTYAGGKTIVISRK
jgi:hypothetical protein